MIDAISRKDHKKRRHATPGLAVHEIYDETGKARPTPCVDQEIRSLLNKGLAQPRWSEDGALAFGKRTLEIAAHEVSSALAKNTAMDKADWARTRQLASEAQMATDLVIEQILRAYEDAPTPASRKVTVNLLSPPIGGIHRMKAARLGKEVSITQTRKRAKKDAEALCRASALLRLISKESSRKRDAIASSSKNPGKPEKVAFARIMMEAWIFLTGKRPSEKNSQFVSFVEAGWFDLGGGEESSWDQPVRKAQNGFSRQDIAAIAERGPSWE